MSNNNEWKIDYLDEKHEKALRKKYTSDKRLEKRWYDFKSDVTKNPYHHPKPRRIVKLKDVKAFLKGTYRYKKEPIRVVYYPKGETKTVYPLEVAKVTDVSYKKRSSR